MKTEIVKATADLINCNDHLNAGLPMIWRIFCKQYELVYEVTVDYTEASEPVFGFPFNAPMFEAFKKAYLSTFDVEDVNTFTLQCEFENTFEQSPDSDKSGIEVFVYQNRRAFNPMTILVPENCAEGIDLKTNKHVHIVTNEAGIPVEKYVYDETTEEWDLIEENQ